MSRVLQRPLLVEQMTELLQEAVDAESDYSTVRVDATSPLVGAEAVLSSMALVSYVVDVEALLADDYASDVILVSERALSRSESPFRTIETLADYIFELAGEVAGESAAG